MTSTPLLVPLHLDALIVQNDRLSIGPSVDFSRLPFVDPRGFDVNPDVANLGEAIIARPFQAQTFLLKAGVHLHWALPDALTHASARAGAKVGRPEFPAVPNRWLVTRLGPTGQLEKAWVVESDYLHPDTLANAGGLDEAQLADANAVSVPSSWSDEKRTPTPRPFRRLGRAVELVSYTAAPVTEDYLSKPLTAMGYGEPTFAALYQNCHSVFGHYDPELPRDGTRYDVVGWYSDSTHDPLRAFIEARDRQAESAEATWAAVQDRFGWRPREGTNPRLPNALFCFVSMTMESASSTAPRSLPAVTLAIGNAGSEALSAYLARALVGADESGATDRSRIEAQLEAVLLSSKLRAQELDRAAKLAEARHEKGFVASQGGWLWTVKADAVTRGADDAPEQEAERTEVDDPQLRAGLAELNELQRDYDRRHLEVESRRSQLFADWCAYLRAAYPAEGGAQESQVMDADHVRCWIEAGSLAALERQLDELGELFLYKDRDDNLLGAGDTLLTPAGVPRHQTVAQRLAAKIQTTLALVKNLNEGRTQSRGMAEPLVLRRIPGPRYYQPTEPVFLLTGKAIQATDRHGRDGRMNADGALDCEPASALSVSAQKALLRLASPDWEDGDREHDVQALADALSALRESESSERIGFCRWTPPWNPILLEWEVSLTPPARAGAHDAYDPGHVVDHFELRPGAVELTPRNTASPGKAGPRYKGSSLLSTHAQRRHCHALLAYVEEHLRHEERDKLGLASLDQVLETRMSALACADDTFFPTRLRGTDRAPNPVYSAFRAFRVLFGKAYVSQALSGFNDALLMRRQAYQLAIEDVLGFEGDKAFAARVRRLVLSHNRSAPEPASVFHPIRAGALSVHGLRLVDTFGQIQDLGLAEVLVADSLGGSDRAVLPPRFVQPARLHLRWLASAGGKCEVQPGTGATPICGWVLPNLLDASLMIFDADGRALGAIASEGEPWQAAPGGHAPPKADAIADPCLRRVAKWLLALRRGDRGAALLQGLLQVLDDVLDTIDPEGFAHHEELAVLIGRPLAVVRARVGLTLAGLPAVHQGLEALLVDLSGGPRRTDRFEDVQIPVRIGERGQVNDGVVGYWTEESLRESEGAVRLSDTLLVPQVDPAHAAGDAVKLASPLLVAPSSAWQTLTLLVDPRAKVHATTGVLPTKVIDIPAQLYTAALKRLDVTFASAPVLTRRGHLDVPLPNEPGYAWSWIERRGEAWRQVVSDLTSSDDEGPFAAPLLARDGWLKLTRRPDVTPEGE